MTRGLILLASLAFAVPGAAQTAPADTPAPPSASTPGPAAGPDQAGPRPDGGVRALRAGCREEAMSHGLKGPARFEAVSACVVRQRPDLAGREQCRAEGLGKGLRKEELRAFVKECVKTRG